MSDACVDDRASTLIRQHGRAAFQWSGLASAAEPTSLNALRALQDTLLHAGRAGDAVAMLRRAAAAAPRLAAVRLQLGDTLCAMGQHSPALDAYQEAVWLAPRDGRAHAALGRVLLHLRRPAEAVESCGRAVQLGYGTPGAWSNLGAAQQALGQREAAVTSFRRAVELLPISAVLLSNLGNALTGAGDFDGARAMCERAVTLDPALAEAQVNLGRALYHSGEREAAAACHRQALALRPGSAAAHLHLGIALLAVGQFREGWAHYEHRLRLPGALRGWQPVQAGQARPRWDGAPMPSRTLLVVAEQGLGDTIQFARFLPLVRRLCGRVVFRVPRRLLALLDEVAELSSDDAPLPHFDAWCPLMSLPHRLGTTLETIPLAAPYLRANPARIERWRRVLPEAGLRVGIAWQGNPAMADDAGRSVPLSLFAPLASIPGVQLVSLQKGAGSEQAHGPQLASLIHHLDGGFDAGPDAFLDTAAVMASLDLVVTTDTAIAHLAGALGIPVWVALRAHPEWRWLSGRDDTPWYRSLRLFRQERDGDWAPVFRRMADELDVLAGQRGPEPSAMPAAPNVTTLGGSVVHVPLSPGDLLDRITILQVKAERIGDEVKRANVLRELMLLRRARDSSGLQFEIVTELESQLRILNGELWNVEDRFRGCERAGAFGLEFVEAARTVIRLNACRAVIKRLINTALGSLLIEEKAYAAQHVQLRRAVANSTVAINQMSGDS